MGRVPRDPFTSPQNRDWMKKVLYLSGRDGWEKLYARAGKMEKTWAAIFQVDQFNNQLFCCILLMRFSRMLDIFNEFVVIIRTLTRKHLEYALCGGLALAVYDIPRATLDIDLLILSDQMEQVEQALHNLGYILKSAPMKFHEGDVEIIRLSKRDPDSEDLLSVDLLKVTAALEEIWQNRRSFELEGGEVAVVSKEGLIAMKQLRGSGQDRDDISKLLGSEE
jgi:hypothetical protein